jgi:hypothetical protein
MAIINLCLLKSCKNCRQCKRQQIPKRYDILSRRIGEYDLSRGLINVIEVTVISLVAMRWPVFETCRVCHGMSDVVLFESSSEQMRVGACKSKGNYLRFRCVSCKIVKIIIMKN